MVASSNDSASLTGPASASHDLPTAADVQHAMAGFMRMVPASALTAYMNAFQWLGPLMSCVHTVLVKPGYVGAVDAAAALYGSVHLAWQTLVAVEKLASPSAVEGHDAGVQVRSRWLQHVLVPALLDRQRWRLDGGLSTATAGTMLLRALDAATVVLTEQQLWDPRAPVHSMRAWACRGVSCMQRGDARARVEAQTALNASDITRVGDILTSAGTGLHAMLPLQPLQLGLHHCYDYTAADLVRASDPTVDRAFTDVNFAVIFEVGERAGCRRGADDSGALRLVLRDPSEWSSEDACRPLTTAVLHGATLENGAGITARIVSMRDVDTILGTVTLLPVRLGALRDMAAFAVVDVRVFPARVKPLTPGKSDTHPGTLAWFLRCVFDTITVAMGSSVSLQVAIPLHAHSSEGAEAFSVQLWDALLAAGFDLFTKQPFDQPSLGNVLTYHARAAHCAFVTRLADTAPFLPSARALFDMSVRLHPRTLRPVSSVDIDGQPAPGQHMELAMDASVLRRIVACALAAMRTDDARRGGLAAATVTYGSHGRRACLARFSADKEIHRQQQLLQSGLLSPGAFTAATFVQGSSVSPVPLQALSRAVLDIIRRMNAARLVQACEGASACPNDGATDAAYVLVPVGCVMQEEAEKLATAYLLHDGTKGVAADTDPVSPVRWLCLETLAATCAEYPLASLQYDGAASSPLKAAVDAMGYCLGAMYDCCALERVFVRNVYARLSCMPALGCAGGAVSDAALIALAAAASASRACAYAARAQFRANWPLMAAGGGDGSSSDVWEGMLRGMHNIVTGDDIMYAWAAHCAPWAAGTRGLKYSRKYLSHVRAQMGTSLRAAFELRALDYQEELSDTLTLYCRRRDAVTRADFERLAAFEGSTKWDDVLDGVISTPSARPWAEVWVENCAGSACSAAGGGASASKIVASLQVGCRGNVADISNAAVDEQHRRSGLLSTMITVVSRTLLRDALPVYLLAHKRAEPTYTALGFTRLLELPEDTVYMVLAPSQPCTVDHGIATRRLHSDSARCVDRRGAQTAETFVLDWDAMDARARELTGLNCLKDLDVAYDGLATGTSCNTTSAEAGRCNNDRKRARVTAE